MFSESFLANLFRRMICDLSEFLFICLKAVQELEPPKYREILSDFVWDMVDEMDFWLKRMENVTVSFPLTLT